MARVSPEVAGDGDFRVQRILSEACLLWLAHAAGVRRGRGCRGANRCQLITRRRSGRAGAGTRQAIDTGLECARGGDERVDRPLLSSRGGICLLSRRYLAERSERQHSKCNAHDAPKKENLS